MKLNLILLFVIILQLFITKHLQTKLSNQEDLTSFYKQNKNILLNKIRSIYDEKILLENENQELQKLSQQDTFNWHQDISNTSVIRKLQKN